MSDGMNLNDLIRESGKDGVTPQYWAISNGYSHMLSSYHLWPDPCVDESSTDTTDGMRVCDPRGDKTILTKYSEEIGKVIQFPVDTVYLFGLGIVASAMIKSFYSQPGPDEKEPVNLYVVCSQPPSTGKSGVVKYLCNPVRRGYKRIAENNAKTRAGILYDIKKTEKEYESSKNRDEASGIAEELVRLYEALSACPEWEYCTDDGTPEAVGQMAQRQGGVFNIISDEADAINTVLGENYKSSSGSTNHSVFLSGWDNGYYKPIRTTRETGKGGNIRGCIAVLAQDESINRLLAAGAGGRGIPERVLMLREPNLLGSRKHSAKRTGVSIKLRGDYEALINNILDEDEDVILMFDDQSLEMIAATKNSVERHLGNGEKYSQSTLRGIVGKLDKQVFKIASILHCVKEWGPRGKKSKSIEWETTHEAIRIFQMLKETYITAADSQGFSGKNTYEREIIACLSMQASKGKLVRTYAALRDLLKNKPSMNGVSSITSLLKKDILPELERRNICVMTDTGVYINPKLRE